MERLLEALSRHRQTYVEHPIDFLLAIVVGGFVVWLAMKALLDIRAERIEKYKEEIERLRKVSNENINPSLAPQEKEPPCIDYSALYDLSETELKEIAIKLYNEAKEFLEINTKDGVTFDGIVSSVLRKSDEYRKFRLKISCVIEEIKYREYRKMADETFSKNPASRYQASIFDDQIRKSLEELKEGIQTLDII